MGHDFRKLIAPNYSAKTSLADLAAYFFGGFLLVLPVLPLSQIRFYFAIFTFFLYAGTIVALAILDFVKALNSARPSIWQIQSIRVTNLIETS